MIGHPLAEEGRTCRDCQGVFPPSNFHKQSKPGRTATYCKACASARSRVWYAANKNKGPETRLRHRIKTPEDARRAKERAAARDHQSWLDNREAELERMRLRYQANPELYRERGRSWRESNRDKTRLSAIAMRCRKRGAELTAKGREFAKALFGDPCAYCGGPSGEIDHIVPMSAGGDSHWTNLTAACRSCNARKHNKSLLTFMMEAAR